MTIRSRYPLNQSPFYKLSSKKKLAEILDSDIKILGKLVDGKMYTTFENKGRPIQTPIRELKKIHKKIFELISRIEVPNYVHAPRKGRSYITNANNHLGNIPIIKTDVCRFYPSVTFDFIFRLFNQTFKCSPDVSWFLSKICCFQGKHLPTGSPISGYLAYFSCKHIFDEIDLLVRSNQCTLTLYVDDITISGKNASKVFLYKVIRVIWNNGLRTKPKKSITFPANHPKTVTGVVISGEKPLIPNRTHKVIWEGRRLLSKIRNPSSRSKIEKSIQGRVQAARQIDPSFK
ncbi:reverse transcriptase family protein [Leptospirillum ferriphilum]|uniref:reverse transcriptase family protein n=1 Tax=Leptospirillum ferriphilum TaxID=178606 RepID=UPI000985869E|nr:reverse transcriptase family protein [Leptospirillum ferriphilum]